MGKEGRKERKKRMKSRVKGQLSAEKNEKSEKYATVEIKAMSQSAAVRN